MTCRSSLVKRHLTDNIEGITQTNVSNLSLLVTTIGVSAYYETHNTCILLQALVRASTQVTNVLMGSGKCFTAYIMINECNVVTLSPSTFIWDSNVSFNIFSHVYVLVYFICLYMSR